MFEINNDSINSKRRIEQLITLDNNTLSNYLIAVINQLRIYDDILNSDTHKASYLSKQINTCYRQAANINGRIDTYLVHSTRPSIAMYQSRVSALTRDVSNEGLKNMFFEYDFAYKFREQIEQYNIFFHKALLEGVYRGIVLINQINNHSAYDGRNIELSLFGNNTQLFQTHIINYYNYLSQTNRLPNNPVNENLANNESTDLQLIPNLQVKEKIETTIRQSQAILVINKSKLLTSKMSNEDNTPIKKTIPNKNREEALKIISSINPDISKVPFEANESSLHDVVDLLNYLDEKNMTSAIIVCDNLFVQRYILLIKAVIDICGHLSTAGLSSLNTTDVMDRTFACLDLPHLLENTPQSFHNVVVSLVKKGLKIEVLGSDYIVNELTPSHSTAQNHVQIISTMVKNAGMEIERGKLKKYTKEQGYIPPKYHSYQ
jgi:hypothetical protein